jgi:hypothetical protein
MIYYGVITYIEPAEVVFAVCAEDVTHRVEPYVQSNGYGATSNGYGVTSNGNGVTSDTHGVIRNA